MEKLRIENKEAYVIEVNDNGDTITLDLKDVSLPIKLMNMMKDIQEKEKEFNERMLEIMQRPDEVIEEEIYGLNVTRNFIDYNIECEKFCNVCRGYIDNIFGKGSAMKIFGEKNNPDMFGDFFDAIQPHIEKAGMTLLQNKKKLVKKYKDEVKGNKGVI